MYNIITNDISLKLDTGRFVGLDADHFDELGLFHVGALENRVHDLQALQ